MLELRFDYEIDTAMSKLVAIDQLKKKVFEEFSGSVDRTVY
jgi:hypothetical protein